LRRKRTASTATLHPRDVRQVLKGASARCVRSLAAVTATSSCNNDDISTLPTVPAVARKLPRAAGHHRVRFASTTSRATDAHYADQVDQALPLLPIWTLSLYHAAENAAGHRRPRSHRSTPRHSCAVTAAAETEREKKWREETEGGEGRLPVLLLVVEHSLAAWKERAPNVEKAAAHTIPRTYIST